MLHFLSKEEHLVGKTIAYSKIDQESGCITLVTKDGGILFYVQHLDWENDECETLKPITLIQSQSLAAMQLAKSPELLEDLLKEKLITQDEIAKLIVSYGTIE